MWRTLTDLNPGLYAKIRDFDIDQINSRFSFQKSFIQIKASHRAGGRPYMIYESLEGKIAGHGGAEKSSSNTRTMILDDNDSALPRKLSEYLRNVEPFMHEGEPSSIWSTTLAFASRLALGNKVETTHLESVLS